MKLKLFFAAVALALFAGATANAQISATVYSVPAGTAETVPPAGSVPGAGATLWATFDTSTLNFNYTTGSFDVGNFINSDSSVSDLNYFNGASGSSSLVNVLFDFTGSAVFTNGEDFTVLHDDGVQLYVDGVSVLSDPDSTSATLTPYSYTGASGTYPFNFIYANSYCCGADFVTTLVTPSTVVSTTPEPSSLLLLGTGALGLLGAIRRRISGSR